MGSEFLSGSKVEVLPGTMRSCGGPHPPPGGWDCKECGRHLRNQEHAEGCSRPGHADEMELLTHCPDCGAALLREEHAPSCAWAKVYEDN